MKTVAQLLAAPFATVSALISAHAREQPQQLALIDGGRTLTYAQLDALINRAAAALQRDGVGNHGVVALCAATSIEYVALFIATLRVGAAACPLAPSASAEQLAAMVRDCAAHVLFLDQSVSAALDTVAEKLEVRHIAVPDAAHPSLESLDTWLAESGAQPAEVDVQPDQPFNIIYSSGTTGTPKGIVQPHLMRWGHVRRAATLGYGPQSITIVSTPLYSNTTLVSLIPTLVFGGTAVLMGKFEARAFLEQAQLHRATHAMLVPVQYRRLMDLPAFDTFDLSSFQMKTCTSAPFAADLKADILRRWPGGLVEMYGMTEGGGSCLLRAHEFPHKLHTVGQPAPGHDIRIINEAGIELTRGESGEIVGRSGSMMKGYHNQPQKTAEAEWHNAQGERYLRTGDRGCFDEAGFLILGDRLKDLIISGGFNIYPSDLEAELAQHAAVAESAVVGIASREWGETPVAYVVLRPGQTIDSEDLRLWVNARVGKTQRLSYLYIVPSLPRSAIGKVLKRQLREEHQPAG